MKNVEQVIDSEILELIEFIQKLSFSECKSVQRILEMEHMRLLEFRELTVKELSECLAKDYITREVALLALNNSLTRYSTTFAIEQRIVDRINIASEIAKTKGVDLNIFKS